jgi:hypothetical protein
MIDFRCWYCNRLHNRRLADVGKEFSCSCECRLRVPSESGGNCRVTTIADVLATTAVYGGGGAVLGLGLALVLLASLRYATWFTPVEFDLAVLLGLPLVGGAVGTLFGERGINWIGRLIRDHEDLPR